MANENGNDEIISEEVASPDGVRPTVKLRQYWKAVVAALAAVSAILTCLYFPPAALFLSPVVDFLAASMAFSGIWAGLVAFSMVVTGVAALTFGATYLLLGGVEWLGSRNSGGAVLSADGAAEKGNAADAVVAVVDLVKKVDNAVVAAAAPPPPAVDAADAAAVAAPPAAAKVDGVADAAPPPAADDAKKGNDVEQSLPPLVTPSPMGAHPQWLNNRFENQENNLLGDRDQGANIVLTF